MQPAQVSAVSELTPFDAAAYTPPSEAALVAFCAHVREQGEFLYRDLPWRRTQDAYEIWISEVMLQQTQVSRVDGRWQRWLAHFPSVEALAAASTAEVLAEWQGLGYNNRALRVKAAAEAVVVAGGWPCEVAELVKLPGIGPATAAGIRAFAFDLPGVYLETNVRTVVLHELFPQVEGVPEKVLATLVAATCPAAAIVSQAAAVARGAQAQEAASDPAGFSAGGAPNPVNPLATPRSWYYAMLDYGAYLKKQVPNPSRRAKSHARQSAFEGSRRQKRAALVRLILASGSSGVTPAAAAVAMSAQEEAAGRAPVSVEFMKELLVELAKEGFCVQRGAAFICA